MEKTQANELRNAVRFPLKLQAWIAGKGGAQEAETRDISANGVLLNVAAEMQVGSAIEFSVTLPAAVLGSERAVMVQCVGRVMRCQRAGERRSVAAVIDEYRFERS